MHEGKPDVLPQNRKKKNRMIPPIQSARDNRLIEKSIGSLRSIKCPRQWESCRVADGGEKGGKNTRRESRVSNLYSLCSDDAGTSSVVTCVFCRRRSGIPPLFFGARLGHNAGCTMLMQSVCAFALQPRHRTPWRLWPRSTWPQASHGVILRYVYSRQVCPPSDSRLFLWK